MDSGLTALVVEDDTHVRRAVRKYKGKDGKAKK